MVNKGRGISMTINDFNIIEAILEAVGLESLTAPRKVK